jgi:hypothetical protein
MFVTPRRTDNRYHALVSIAAAEKDLDGSGRHACFGAGFGTLGWTSAE